MTGTHIKIESNAEDVLGVFSELSRRAGTQEPLWKDVGEHLLLSHRYRFDLAISPDGKLWEPLDPDYQRRKKRRKNDILVLDAFLRDQLSYVAGQTTLEFGSNRIYAATHQFGDDDRNIPARPFLGISDDDESEILRLAEKHLAQALENATASERL